MNDTSTMSFCSYRCVVWASGNWDADACTNCERGPIRVSYRHGRAERFCPFGLDYTFLPAALLRFSYVVSSAQVCNVFYKRAQWLSAWQLGVVCLHWAWCSCWWVLCALTEPELLNEMQDFVNMPLKFIQSHSLFAIRLSIYSSWFFSMLPVVHKFSAAASNIVTEALLCCQLLEFF